MNDKKHAEIDKKHAEIDKKLQIEGGTTVKETSCIRWFAMCIFVFCGIAGASQRGNDLVESSSTAGANSALQLSISRNAKKTAVSARRRLVGATRMRQRLKKTIRKLPPPRWPQFDHGTSEAISDGIIFGPPAPPNPMSTIVTAYYQFPSKHNSSYYKTAIDRLLEVTDPMIIFLEPGSMWIDWFMARRQHAPTIIAQRSFSDLVMNTSFTEEFWLDQLHIDPFKELHNGTGVFKIWNEKLVFLKAAAQLNPFKSYHFAWMDAGYFYKKIPKKENLNPLIKINITEAGVSPEASLFLHVCDLDPTEIGENCGDAGDNFAIAGNSFLGTASAINLIYDKYFETFWSMAQRNIFVGDDQHVMTQNCCNHLHLCHLYFPGYFRLWFTIGDKVLFTPNYDLAPSSPRFAETCGKRRIEPVLPLPDDVVSGNRTRVK